ncbi:hypothetical protein D4764_16G0010130 [Takifugu flavidus]|uniref:Tetratricopeptide repeat protein 31 n=1 Tax=Takifugu flavidus TaxID=433684 RepID=A0A5C6P0D8_9TELE|nr:hypothetical protein D4764_16G0010130 [Takifugu flavidus]
MPRKRNSVKPSAPIPGIQEEPRVLLPFDSVVEYIHRRSFLNFITSGFFGLDEPILNTHQDYYHSYPYISPRNGLEPHPRIRELAEEEADKHAQELIEEEKRHKERTEKNRHPQSYRFFYFMSSLEDHEENSENHREADFIESDGGTNTPVDTSAETPNPTKSDERSEANEEEERSEANEEEERSEAHEEEENSVRTPEEDNAEMKVEFKCSFLSITCHNGVQVLPREPDSDPQPATAEEHEKRSRDLAGMGFRLASSGQYELAVKFFTDAISYNPKEFKLFGNRSLCYERLQQYENACRDADVALLIEPKWIKGLFRKGKALCGLKRYYEASLVYREVMDLDSSSTEAKQELKRAQTLHLTEMGFSWAESSKALETHPTMEEAIESLFHGDDSIEGSEEAAMQEDDDSSEKEEEEEEEEKWLVKRSRRHRGKQKGASASLSGVRAPPTPQAGRAGKPELFSVWVGVLAPSVTYVMLMQLFSSVLVTLLFSVLAAGVRAGTVYSIKMLLEHQCAFVNYTRGEDCHRAIQHLDGMILEGAPLSVRYPSPSLCTDPCRSKECFFWRTMGCTRPDCIYKHDPNHRGIDRHKFTTGLGNFHT